MAANRPSKSHRRPAICLAAWVGIFIASVLESCQPRLLGRPQALSTPTLVSPHSCFVAATPLLAGAARARTGACPASGRSSAVVRAVAPLADGELEVAQEASRPLGRVLWIAFVAGCCLLSHTDAAFWSAALGLGIRKGFMKAGSLRTAPGSMSHFALRGATIGVVLSLLLSGAFVGVIGVVSRALVQTSSLQGTAGGLEELAKFVALVWFSWSGPKFWQRKQPLAKSWPQTPRAVMLAGFSVGVGFTVVENAMHMKVASKALLAKIQFCLSNYGTIPPGFFRQLLSQYLQLAFFRIVTDPHALLSGTAAGRFAERYCNRERRLSAASLWDVLWPSVTLHVISNWMTLAVGSWGKTVVWIVSITVFVKTWSRLAVSSAQPLETQLDGNVASQV